MLNHEIADFLAKEGAGDSSVPSASLTYLEICSKTKCKNKSSWLTPPVHRWHQGNHPGGSLALSCNRQDQITLTRFISGHLRSMNFVDGTRCFEVCSKCSTEQASPLNIFLHVWVSL